MTTIHMDIEAMLMIQRDLMTIAERIQRRTKPLQNDYRALPLHWSGNSANEYFDHYTEFEESVAGVVATLTEIAAELSGEISNWESMDSGLGD